MRHAGAGFSSMAFIGEPCPTNNIGMRVDADRIVIGRSNVAQARSLPAATATRR